MNAFKSYLTKRYCTLIQYRNHNGESKLDHMREMCANCGQPYGFHWLRESVTNACIPKKELREVGKIPFSKRIVPQKLR